MFKFCDYEDRGSNFLEYPHSHTPLSSCESTMQVAELLLSTNCERVNRFKDFEYNNSFIDRICYLINNENLSKGFDNLNVNFLSLSEIQTKLADESLIISIYSEEGYNFSNEYIHIYGGKFDKATAVDDLIAVISRAIQTIKATVTSDVSKLYASFILSMTAAESLASNTLSDLIITDIFPSIQKSSLISTSFNFMKVFIGKNDHDELYITIRSTPTKFSSKSKLSLTYYSHHIIDTHCQDILRQEKYISMGVYKEKIGFNIPIQTEYTSLQDPHNVALLISLKITPQIIPTPSNVATMDTKPIHYSIFDGLDSQLSIEPPATTETIKRNENCVNNDVNSKVSFSNELIGWGFDSEHSLGVGLDTRKISNAIDRANRNKKEVSDETVGELLDQIHDPRPIPIPPSIRLEGIQQIACSARHSIILTQYGNMYACGENSEGALGVDDFQSRETFTLLNFSERKEFNSIKFIKIAAGSEAIGSHSMAMTSEGKLYGWGAGSCIGIGNIQSYNSPTEITLKQLEEGPRTLEGVAETLPTPLVHDVSCGGAFTIVVLKSGKVCTFGMWAHGRLGLGPVPFKLGVGNRKNAKKVAKYQLVPKFINGIEHAVAVACGEAHALCLLKSGSILSWGKNSCGQLGIGPNCEGNLTDHFTPVHIPPFGNVMNCHEARTFSRSDGNYQYVSKSAISNLSGRSVYAGSFHSIVIDKQNNYVWSWGARGSPCLGHNDAKVIGGEWTQRINVLFSISRAVSEIVVPYELLPWCTQWSMPRCVNALIGIPISMVSAGDLHTAFISNSGQFYLCGSGPSVPQFVPVSRILDYEEIDYDDDDDDEEDEDGQRVTKNQSAKKETHLNSIKNETAEIVAMPRCSSSNWLPDICTRTVRYVSGAGSRIFVIVDEEVTCHSLTAGLLNKLIHQKDKKEDDSVGDFSGTALTGETDLYNHYQSVFEERGKADCMLVSSGKIFLAHKAILAQRSSELRETILMETPSDFMESAQPIQIFLPELRSDVTKALLYFLYTDSLPNWVIGDVGVLTSLIRCAKNLKIPRLQLLCERYYKLINGDGAKQFATMTYTEFELPPLTLCRDMGALVGDGEFADVRFVAEGRPLYAHKFILEQRCDYFRVMFGSGMSETYFTEKTTNLLNIKKTRHNVMDVVVPDSYVGLLRLMIYIYTGTLPDGSDGALLEDLMASDRYDVPGMKLLCENMLCPSSLNWLDLLRASTVVNSFRLQLQVVTFLRDNFHVLENFFDVEELPDKTTVEKKIDIVSFLDAIESKQDDLQMKPPAIKLFEQEFPNMLEKVLHLRSNLQPRAPIKLLIDQQQQSVKVMEENYRMPMFPFWTLILAAICLIGFQNLSTVVTMGPLIPIINIVGLIIMMYTAYNVINTRWS